MRVSLSNQNVAGGASSDENRLRLSSIFTRRVAAYAMAAGAAGVGVAAMATESAQGPIVFTPAHIFMGGLGPTNLNIDLNHDGIPDFHLMMTNTRYNNIFSAEARGSLWENPEPGNSARARALPKGALIGGSGMFGAGRYRLAWGDSVNHSGHDGYYTGGPWANSSPDSYLGVRFLMNGETHYGWMRMTVVAYPYEVYAIITGYAYNTVPNQPLRAGEGALPSKAAKARPASLGVLALGAAGLPLWRGETQP